MRMLLAATAAFAVFSTCAQAEEIRHAMGVTPPAPIVFFDIAGPDAVVLHKFYASVFAWPIDANNGIKTPKLEGTLRQDPPEKVIYVGVHDINAALEKIQQQGGTVDTPRTVVPNVVTFALFKDPAGNRMGLVEIPRN